MGKYLRFGKIPVNGKSINFLKMSNQEVEDFSDCLKMGDIDQAFEYIPKDAYESGLSVFEIGSEGLPLIESMRQIISLSVRLEEPKFIVTGEKVGQGNDSEPLINVKSVKPIEIDKRKLINLIQNTLKSNFSIVKYNKNEDFGTNEVHCFYTGEVPEYCFNGWVFMDPKDDFDVSTGIKGRR